MRAYKVVGRPHPTGFSRKPESVVTTETDPAKWQEERNVFIGRYGVYNLWAHKGRRHNYAGYDINGCGIRWERMKPTMPSYISKETEAAYQRALSMGVPCLGY